MKLEKELDMLVAETVITEETAGKIRAYYHGKQQRITPKLLLSVLGSLLLGVGIILLLAHNWDMLAKPVKILFAFTPLIIGQCLCGYSLLKKENDRSWTESSGIFLSLGFAACIALISQIYHIKGSMESFLFLWAAMSLPLIYIMRSSVSGLIYLAVISYYAQKTGQLPLFYLAFLAGIIPYYYRLYTEDVQNRFLPVFNLFMLISFTATIGLWVEGHLQIPFSVTVFALYILLSQTSFMEKQRLKGVFFFLFGNGGMFIILFLLAFTNVGNEAYFWFFGSVNTAIVLMLFSAALVFFILLYRKTPVYRIPFMSAVFIPLFVLLMEPNINIHNWYAKALIFIVALELIIKGLRGHIFSRLNGGLVLLLLFATILFFDTRITFVVRGSLFIAVGAGFFIANAVLLKKRGKNEEN